MAIPDLANVKAYLSQNGLTSYSDATAAEALAAETAAQAAVCRIGDPMVDDLAEALRRRVARNLAMRALPLGVMADEAGGTRLASNDPEVRRLEKPHRKVFVG